MNREHKPPLTFNYTLVRYLPCEPFFVDIDSERVDTCDEDIDAEIKLELVDEEGVLDVALDTQLRLLVGDVGELVDHPDSHPAEQIRRLNDPELVRMLLHVAHDLLLVCRKHECQWHKVKIGFPKLFPHGSVVFEQIIFPPELMHGRELVYFHHLVQFVKVDYVRVFLRDREGVPDCPISNIALKLSDPGLEKYFKII